MKENKGSRKYLIFLTSGFPYENGETFIENEVPFLASSFEKILMLVPGGIVPQKKRAVPENVIIVQVQQGLSWPLRVRSLFCPTFWQGFSLDLKRKNRKAGFFDVFRNCWYYFFQALQANKAIQKTIMHYDLMEEETILYSYWFDEKALGIALVKKEMPNIKVVSRAHGWDVFEERHQSPYLPFRPFLFKTLDKVAVVSKKGAEYLIKKFDPPKGSAVVSYLGTKQLNEKLKVKSEKFHLVSCSNLIPLKRVELIIEALSFLDFPVNWTHIGDGTLRKELEKRAARLFEGKKIDYRFTGQLTNKQVREFYESQYVDFFISISETEGLPVSMMEAQSAGIPILATDVGGVNEIVIDGVTGWLLPSNPEPGLVAEKIREIFKMKEVERNTIRENAVIHWQTNFDASKNYPEFIILLKSI